jgi:hypothetical protein
MIWKINLLVDYQGGDEKVTTTAKMCYLKDINVP